MATVWTNWFPDLHEPSRWYQSCLDNIKPLSDHNLMHTLCTIPRFKQKIIDIIFGNKVKYGWNKYWSETILAAFGLDDDCSEHTKEHSPTLAPILDAPLVHLARKRGEARASRRHTFYKLIELKLYKKEWCTTMVLLHSNQNQRGGSSYQHLCRKRWACFRLPQTN